MKTFKPYMLINNYEQKLTLGRIDCSQTIAPDNYHIYIKDEWVEVFAVEARLTGSGPLYRKMRISASGFAAEHLMLLGAEIGDNEGSVLLRSREGDLIDIAFKWLSSYLYLHGDFMANKKKERIEMEFRVVVADGKEIIGYGADTESDSDRRFYVEVMSHSDCITLVQAIAQNNNLVVEQIIHEK